jgi:hypothetical protein
MSGCGLDGLDGNAFLEILPNGLSANAAAQR